MTNAITSQYATLAVRRTASKKLADVNSQLTSLRAKISKIDGDIQKALQAFIDGEIDKEEKEQFQSALRLKRIDAEGQIDKLEGTQRLNEATIDYVCNFIDAPARMWLDSDPLTKIEFQKMVSESGIVFDIKKETFGTIGLTPFYRLKDTQKASNEASESIMVNLINYKSGSGTPVFLDTSLAHSTRRENCTSRAACSASSLSSRLAITSGASLRLRISVFTSTNSPATSPRKSSMYLKSFVN